MLRICFILIITLTGCRSTFVLNLPPATLDVNGPISVDVRSFAGSVTLIADPDAPGAVISVVQRDIGNDVNRKPVTRIAWSANVEIGSFGEMLSVEATSDSDSLRSLRADITIRAPLIHNVTIHTEQGDVTVVGTSGSLTIQTSDGDVRVVTPYALNQKVTIENRRGNIVYRVSGTSSGIIDATAMNGAASLHVRQGDTTILPGTTGDHLIASFNDGLNPMVMRTVEGDIRIYVLENPAANEPWFTADWVSW
jgi:hypothetical protein